MPNTQTIRGNCLYGEPPGPAAARPVIVQRLDHPIRYAIRLAQWLPALHVMTRDQVATALGEWLAMPTTELDAEITAHDPADVAFLLGQHRDRHLSAGPEGAIRPPGDPHDDTPF